MIDIRPFKGITYNTTSANSFSKYISPPYDVISEAKRDMLYDLDQYNFVRIDFNRPEPQEGNPNAKYDRSARLLKEWLGSGILVEDGNPCMYIYQETFSIPSQKSHVTRTGLIAALKLQEFEKGNIFPHEYTFSGPKADRADLMRATDSMTGQIFTLFSDDEATILNLLLNITAAQKSMAVADTDEIKHELWRISDSSTIQKICDLMTEKKLVIADGHHRYETALNYKNEKRKTTPGPNGDALMITMVSMSDPGLVILPIHRVVKDVKHVGWEVIRNKIETFFILEECVETSTNDIVPLLATKGKKQTTFYLKRKNGPAYWVLLKDGIDIKALGDNTHTSAWNKLDVSILQNFIFKNALRFTDESIVRREGIDCIKDVDEATALLDQSDFDFLFLLNPVNMDELNSIVQNGERMPQKSTNFHPKVYSGLVMQKL